MKTGNSECLTYMRGHVPTCVVTYTRCKNSDYHQWLLDETVHHFTSMFGHVCIRWQQRERVGMLKQWFIFTAGWLSREYKLIAAQSRLYQVITEKESRYDRTVNITNFWSVKTSKLCLVRLYHVIPTWHARNDHVLWKQCMCMIPCGCIAGCLIKEFFKPPYNP